MLCCGGATAGERSSGSLESYCIYGADKLGVMRKVLCRSAVKNDCTFQPSSHYCFLEKFSNCLGCKFLNCLSRIPRTTVRSPFAGTDGFGDFKAV